MVRALQKRDIDRVAEIWLECNQKAHAFIPAAYWMQNFDMVKAVLPQAEVYVYEHEHRIQGFAGLRGDYIEGLFVASECQSCGIGALLLNHLKGTRTTLQLKVYQKNTRALIFYLREGFKILSEGVDETTGEKEYVMIWQEQKRKSVY